MTVRELKAAMDGLSDDAKVIVEDYDDESECCKDEISLVRAEHIFYGEDTGSGREERLVIVTNAI